jgi:hypothetical protein
VAAAASIFFFPEKRQSGIMIMPLPRATIEPPLRCQ